MARIGAFCFPGTGHINPMTALARRLQQRGHEVVVDARQRPKVDFAWERLDGRPLVYASLGTLQNGSEDIFRIIADACACLDAQLVISLGGGLDPERLGPLAGDPAVVKYMRHNWKS